jgi:hypothetical protein
MYAERMESSPAEQKPAAGVLGPLCAAVDARLGVFAVRLTTGPRWKARALLFVLSFSLFRAFPNYNVLRQPEVVNTWKEVAIKIAHPATDMVRLFPADSHEAKLNFRLTVPLIAHVFHLGTAGQLALFAVCGALLLLCALTLAERATGSRTVALYVTLAIACTWPGVLAFHQLQGGFYDAVALLLLLFAMAARRPAVAGAALFAAAWTDERALLVAPLVCLFALAQSERSRCAAVLLGVAAYLAGRIWLAHAWALHTTMAGVGIPIFLRDLHMAPLGLWAGLTGTWIVIVCALAILAARRRYFEFAGLAFGVALLTACALGLEDQARTMAYALPAVFVALQVLAKNETPGTVERIAKATALVCALLPTWFVQSGNATWILPLPVQLFRLFVYPRFG